jgi:hypothetical protein
VTDHEQRLRATDVLRDFGSVATDGVVTLPRGAAMTAQIRRDTATKRALLDRSLHTAPYGSRRAETMQQDDGFAHERILAA